MAEDTATVLLPAPSLRARFDAWRLHRRAIRGTRRERAATATLAAVGRLSGVQRSGLRVAGVCVALGVLAGLILAVAVLGAAHRT